ncbi:MAG: ANTAR domain-containing protein [Nocardioidaceae bacterium]
MANLATIGLLQERATSRAEVLTEQLQGALNSRIILEQAKGALAQMRGAGVDDAFERMRAYARDNHRRLGDVAQTVLFDPASIADRTAPHRPPH